MTQELNNMRPILYDTDEVTVSGDDSLEAKEKIFARLMKYFKEHQAFHGEVICQSDRCIIDATTVLSDIADDIIKFQTNYK